MDKRVDHIFVFEGDGKVKDFPGTYSEYRAWRRGIPAGGNENTPSERAGYKEKPKSKTGLSYKQQKELEAIEEEIPVLEEEKKNIEDIFSSGEELTAGRIGELSDRMKDVLSRLDMLEERWLELSEIREGAG